MTLPGPEEPRSAVPVPSAQDSRLVQAGGDKALLEQCSKSYPVLEPTDPRQNLCGRLLAETVQRCTKAEQGLRDITDRIVKARDELQELQTQLERQPWRGIWPGCSTSSSITKQRD